MKIEIGILHDLKYEVHSQSIKYIGNKNALRLLKGIYTNKERFIDRYLSVYEKIELLEPIYNFFLENYDNTIPFSYKEAFEIKDEDFRTRVFNTIDITDMIENLGATRIKVDGKEVSRKCFDKLGNTLPNKNYHAVYETYQINCTKLVPDSDFREPISFAYAVKCWCTSTNKAHWIWIDEAYKEEPLEAIASTFRFHENVIPHIKELKRQGDIMLVELTKEIEPRGSIIPLTAEQYFRLLTIET
jgi:hypothetical protein